MCKASLVREYHITPIDGTTKSEEEGQFQALDQVSSNVLKKGIFNLTACLSFHNIFGRAFTEIKV